MESARYKVHMQSGRKFLVEEWGTNFTQWGDGVERIDCELIKYVEKNPF